MPSTDRFGLLGTTIASDSLLLVSVLGSGTYGVVYRAIDTDPDPTLPSEASPTSYAVKVLRRVPRTHPDRKYQDREIKLHALVSSHPNIITQHGVLREGPYIVHVMQYCAGGDLYDAIHEEKRVFGKEEVLRGVLLGVVDALIECHEKGVFHGDLKAENVLCEFEEENEGEECEGGDEKVKVYLADFGLSTDRPRCRSCMRGTKMYMAPECPGPLFEEPHLSTAKIDIWALGCLIIFAIGGHIPWDRASLNDRSFRSFLRNPFYLQTCIPISSAAEALIHRILDLRPERRPSLREIRKEIVDMKRLWMGEREVEWATEDVKATVEYFNLRVDRDLDSSQEESDSMTGTTESSTTGLRTPADGNIPMEPRTLADELLDALEAACIADSNSDGLAGLPNTDILPCLGEDMSLLNTPKLGLGAGLSALEKRESGL